MIPEGAIGCLDEGYVRYVEHMGGDLSVVNAARVSFEKESKRFEDRDDRLLKYLLRKKEYSPFRHGVIKFEVYAPLLTARQWWKYVVGSAHTMDAWNESSRRYVTEDPVYYSPEWRAAPENRKQGSGERIELSVWDAKIEARQEQSTEDYEAAIRAGIAPEQARVFLLAYGLYIRWQWTASLESVFHVLNQRLADDAQYEFRVYAAAVRDLAAPRFPRCFEAYGL